MINQVGCVDLTMQEHHTSALEPGRKPRELLKKMSSNIITLIHGSNAVPFVQSYDKFRCFYCKEKYASMCVLRDHSKVEHSTPNVKPHLDVLRKGSYVMVDINDLRCRQCDASTPTLYHLRTHLAEHGHLLDEDVPEGLIPFRLTGDSHDCLICGEQFVLFQMLSQHMNVHYGDKVCEVCGAQFLSSGRLKSHKVIHKEREVGSYLCNTCNKECKTELQLKRHIDRVHVKKPRYKCPICHETFTEYYIRISHMYNVHDIEPKEYKCDICGLGYRRPREARNHMKKCRMIMEEAVEKGLRVVMEEGEMELKIDEDA